ncbi:hypothetical protein NPIL_167241 [Nephila pilipes]|uniref:Uncharacterized protein n=1 Tax=Nephila pilipes TaxID=299642 RepID=A0A8X6MPC3_NEPPI|nr:hypothetical protein NPIL_167241 [Nephila pilipes]
MAVERPKPLGDLPASSDGWLRLSNKPASVSGNDRAKARRPVKEGYGMVVPFTGTCRPLVITFLRGEKWGWLRLWCFPIFIGKLAGQHCSFGRAPSVVVKLNEKMIKRLEGRIVPYGGNFF